jgi:sugar-phosphatase
MFTPHLHAEKEAAALDHREAADLDGLRAVPGAHELLAKVPAGRWAVATSGTDEVARTRLRALKFPIPQVLISSNSVQNGKPAPEPYLRAAAGLGVAPADCLVIEDAPAGIESARAAGMQVIALTTTFNADALAAADAILSDLKSLQLEVTQAGLKISSRTPL